MATGHRHIGLIGAMAQEVERLHVHLESETTAEHAGRLYRTGMLGNQRVTVVQSRIGKVAAALTAAALIRDHDVDAIVFTGIAGALHDDLAIGDVVVATELIQHDLAGPPEMFVRGEVPLLGVVELATDPELTDRALRAAGDFVDDGLDAVVSDEALARLGIGRPSVHAGQVATGDEFIEGELKSVVRRRAPSALCVDMEGAAVAQVCHELGGVPLCDLGSRERNGLGRLPEVPRPTGLALLLRDRPPHVRVTDVQRCADAVRAPDLPHRCRADDERRLRGLHRHRRSLGAPASVHDLRARGVLQRLTQSPRCRALRPHRTSGDPVVRAR
jgi:adenosylhomocysteine nucleosidase